MSDEYEVGYGCPPKETQFQKGSSGNPKGRPKGTNNLRTDLSEELNEQIVIREGGRQIKVSKQRAVVKSLTAKALKGDSRAVGLIVTMCGQLLGEEGASDEADGEILAPEERDVLAVLQNRLLEEQGQSAQADTTDGGDDEEESSDE